ncbi:MAG: hypothetical protein ACI845_000200 [Gammaproteobacteria bacterium]|jgi:hypothetical protein
MVHAKSDSENLNTKAQFLSKRCEWPVYQASSPGRTAHFVVDQGLTWSDIVVENGRLNNGQEEIREFGMNACGVNLIEHQTAVNNFLDKDQTDTTYTTEIDALLKAITGCYRTHIFDLTVRASDPELREIKQVREASLLVHNDYTARSGFTCLHESLKEEAEALAEGRFQIINVWRPLVNPVENFPLAFCDKRSIDPEDLIDTIRKGPTHEGEIILAVHNPAQRWFYYPEMNPDEVLLFKTFDSISLGGEPCSFHSAIEIPGAEDAPPRESVEIRALVFYH